MAQDAVEGSNDAFVCTTPCKYRADKESRLRRHQKSSGCIRWVSLVGKYRAAIGSVPKSPG